MTRKLTHPKHYCLWILASGEYCKKKVEYRLGYDDDNRQYRVYDTFCCEHQMQAEEQKRTLEFIAEGELFDD